MPLRGETCFKRDAGPRARSKSAENVKPADVFFHNRRIERVTGRKGSASEPQLPRRTDNSDPIPRRHSGKKKGNGSRGQRPD